eukprot:2964343-Rhodomonas_salina.1
MGLGLTGRPNTGLRQDPTGHDVSPGSGISYISTGHSIACRRCQHQTSHRTTNADTARVSNKTLEHKALDVAPPKYLRLAFVSVCLAFGARDRLCTARCYLQAPTTHLRSTSLHTSPASEEAKKRRSEKKRETCRDRQGTTTDIHMAQTQSHSHKDSSAITNAFPQSRQTWFRRARLLVCGAASTEESRVARQSVRCNGPFRTVPPSRARAVSLVCAGSSRAKGANWTELAGRIGGPRVAVLAGHGAARALVFVLALAPE